MFPLMCEDTKLGTTILNLNTRQAHETLGQSQYFMRKRMIKKPSGSGPEIRHCLFGGR